MDERKAALAKFNMYKCLVVCAVTLALCGAVAVIVCGVIIVKPVVETKSLEFQQTSCTTTKSYLTGKWFSCGCGKNCRSEYPCLRILVKHGGQNNGTYSGVMFDTEQRLNQNGHLDEASQCALAPCDRNKGSNLATVLAFNNTYATGETYKCLFHPDDPAKVLLKRLFTWDAMFHSMLWSSIACVIFTGLTVYFGYQCYKAGKKMSSMPIVVPGAPAAQPGHFLPPGGQAQYPQAMPMQPQNPYQVDYGMKTGYTNNTYS